MAPQLTEPHSGAPGGGTGTALVRVVVVDDSPEIRTMLRLLLGRDPRFQVIGEAENGRDGVEMCGLLQPDLVILDRQMPVMGGLEAIPEIRGRAPDSEIVLYTAGAEEDTEQAATAAGAIGLLEKRGVALNVAQDLAGILARHWADHAGQVEIRVGPVPSESARLWVPNTRRILEAVKRHPEAVGGAISAQVMDLFERFLDAWEAVARETDVFFWTGRAGPDEVQEVVEEWARIDAMSDETLASLGCHWSPPAARVFFDALTTAVVEALTKHAETRRLAERLVGSGWSSPPGLSKKS